MTGNFKTNFITRVTEAIRALGYNLTREPSRIPNRGFWRDDPASLVRGLRYRPDILVEQGERFVIVEAKTRPVLLGGVMQASKLADYFGAMVIVCMPDDVFGKLPGSVREFAADRHIRLCPLAEIGKALRDTLD